MDSYESNAVLGSRLPPLVLTLGFWLPGAMYHCSACNVTACDLCRVLSRYRQVAVHAEALPSSSHSEASGSSIAPTAPGHTIIPAPIFPDPTLPSLTPTNQRASSHQSSSRPVAPTRKSATPPPASQMRAAAETKDSEGRKSRDGQSRSKSSASAGLRRKDFSGPKRSLLWSDSSESDTEAGDRGGGEEGHGLRRRQDPISQSVDQWWRDHDHNLGSGLGLRLGQQSNVGSATQAPIRAPAAKQIAKLLRPEPEPEPLLEDATLSVWPRSLASDPPPSADQRPGSSERSIRGHDTDRARAQARSSASVSHADRHNPTSIQLSNSTPSIEARSKAADSDASLSRSRVDRAPVRDPHASTLVPQRSDRETAEAEDPDMKAPLVFKGSTPPEPVLPAWISPVLFGGSSERSERRNGDFEGSIAAGRKEDASDFAVKVAAGSGQLLLTMSNLVVTFDLARATDSNSETSANQGADPTQTGRSQYVSGQAQGNASQASMRSQPGSESSQIRPSQLFAAHTPDASQAEALGSHTPGTGSALSAVSSIMDSRGGLERDDELSEIGEGSSIMVVQPWVSGLGDSDCLVELPSVDYGDVSMESYRAGDDQDDGSSSVASGAGSKGMTELFRGLEELHLDLEQMQETTEDHEREVRTQDGDARGSRASVEDEESRAREGERDLVLGLDQDLDKEFDSPSPHRKRSIEPLYQEEQRQLGVVGLGGREAWVLMIRY